MPPFDERPTSFVSIILGRRQDRSLLESGDTLVAITSRILTESDQRKQQEIDIASNTRRTTVLEEIALELGLSARDIDRAIRTQADRSGDPLERGLAALYEKKYSLAATLLEKSLESAQEKKRILDDDIVESARYLGQALRELGKYPQSVAAFKEALILRPSDPELLNEFGYSLIRNGEYSRAEGTLRRSVEILKSSIGSRHPLTLAATNNLAEALRGSGDLAAARDLHKQVLSARREILGQEHPSTLRTMRGLSTTLVLQQDFQAAQQLLDQMLEITERASRRSPYAVFTPRTNLAVAPIQQGNAEGAEEERETLRKRWLDDRDEDKKLDIFFEDQGDLAQVRDYLYRETISSRQDLSAAVEIGENVLGISSSMSGSSALTMVNLANLLALKGDFTGARRLYSKALEDSCYCLDTKKRLSVKSNLAETIRFQGDLAGARAIHEEVLEERRRELGPDHPSTLDSMNNLAETIRAQGDLRKAREIFEKVLEDRRRTLGAVHPDTLTSMNNLAETKRDLGDLRGAHDLHERTLAIRGEVLGVAHPDTLDSGNNFAETVRAQGELWLALEMHNNTLSTRLRVLGTKHPDTLKSRHNLAEVLRELGDLEQARRLHESVLVDRGLALGTGKRSDSAEVIELAERRLERGPWHAGPKVQDDESRSQITGGEHPDTLSSMSSFAETIREQGEVSAARRLHEEVLRKRAAILGPEHPDVSSSMNDLAETLRMQGDLAAAHQLHQDTLNLRRNILGVEHPDTLSSMANLADTIREEGDLRTARRLQEQVLGSRRRLLGSEHPGTLKTMNDLAVTLRELGELSASRKLGEVVVRAQRRRFGEQFPGTIVSSWNLFLACELIEDNSSAARILETLCGSIERSGPPLPASQQKVHADIARRCDALGRSAPKFGSGL
ncbi:MAG: tetratricopeptide repeat protein [bacterium]|nr:tetratricopeptide repeat protein [bacterium]